jgi:hypothetical protein
MTPYISTDGADELAAFRGGPKPAPTKGPAPIELLAQVPSDECGCPEEIWRVDGVLYLIHMETEASTGEIFAFFGDAEEEHLVKASTLAELRAEMFEIHAQLPDEDFCKRKAAAAVRFASDYGPLPSAQAGHPLGLEAVTERLDRFLAESGLKIVNANS